MNLTWTKAAEKHLLYSLKNLQDAIAVQLSVKKMGCSGYGYVIDLLNKIPEDSIQIKFVEDYVIVIKNQDLSILNGLVIDYVTHGVNSKIVFNNPNQTGQCGCDESFTVN